MKRIERIKNVLTTIWIVLFAVEYAYVTLNNIMQSFTSNPYVVLFMSVIQDIMLFVTLTHIAIHFILSDRRVQEIVLLCIKVLIVVVSLRYTDNYGLGMMLLFAVSSDNIEENIILKIAFIIGTSLVILSFFLSVGGVIENNRGNSFGFSYRTHYAFFLVSMVMVWCLLKDGYLTWVGELGLIGVLCYDIFAVRGKTSILVLTVLIVVIYSRHYLKNTGVPYQDKKRYGLVIPVVFQILYTPIWGTSRIAEILRNIKTNLCKVMKYSFLLCAGISVALTLLCRLVLTRIDSNPLLQTFGSRLFLGLIGFEEYPIRLFGNEIPGRGIGGSETENLLYFVFDSSYIKLLLEHGLIIFIVVLLLMTMAMWRLYGSGRYFGMIVLSVFAAYCMIEIHLRNLSYNPYIMLSFCTLSRKEGIIACTKLDFERIIIRKRIAITTVIIVMCFFTGTWISTAYQITNWRGWTPDYNATIVLPGQYVDDIESDLLVNIRIQRAKSYLSYRKDAYCLVSTEIEKNRLIEQNIDSSRIFVDEESDSLDEMLLYAEKLIREKQLPERLTVCTYDIQQKNIERHSANLHIPVNSLTMKAPWNLYLGLLAREQWKLLWKK